MRINFTPTTEWSALFDDLKKEVESLGGTQKVNLTKIFNDVHLDKIPTPVQILEKILSRATEAQAKKIADMFSDLWNLTPRAAFDGKTPNQMAEDLAAQAPRRRQSPGWAKIMELLLNIQGNFQAEFYGAIKRLTTKQQEVVIHYSHRLFERYLYAVAEELLPDQAAPADLILGHLEHEGIAFPKNTQEQIRVFKTPVKNPQPNQRLRMIVGEETVDCFPLVSDYLAGRQKSELYTKDVYYNRMLVAVAKRHPETEIQAMAAGWEYAVEAWRASSMSLRKAYSEQEWHEWWKGQFDLACNDWVSTDEIFEAIIKRTHHQVMPMQAVMDQLNAPRGRFIEPQDIDELAAYMMLFDAQVAYAREFIDPLATYLPLIEARYIEPLVIAEELDAMSTTAQNFVNSISKPPSYFTLRSPLGRQLWKKIRKELA